MVRGWATNVQALKNDVELRGIRHAHIRDGMNEHKTRTS